jgi:uncharacterized membrane protein YgdD (TMEM256/DUF423 family)
MNSFSLGAFLAALAIALGAFGAHALGGREPARHAWWTTAGQYHFIGSVGLLADGLLDSRRGVRGPALAFLAGILLFSGSLYAMALGAPRVLGAITPLGGLALIAGFIWLGIRQFQRRGTRAP